MLLLTNSTSTSTSQFRVVIVRYSVCSTHWVVLWCCSTPAHACHVLGGSCCSGCHSTWGDWCAALRILWSLVLKRWFLVYKVKTEALSFHTNHGWFATLPNWNKNWNKQQLIKVGTCPCYLRLNEMLLRKVLAPYWVYVLIYTVYAYTTKLGF